MIKYICWILINEIQLYCQPFFIGLQVYLLHLDLGNLHILERIWNLFLIDKFYKNPYMKGQ